MSVLLTSCTGGDADAKKQAEMFGSRIGIAASYILSLQTKGSMNLVRPSPTMGIFTSSYLAQGAFINVQAAALGIQAQKKLLTGQSLPASSETFILLQELGTALQVDIVDMLNRAGNRGEALDAYIDSLKGIGSLSVRKQKELEQLQATFKTQKRDEQAALRTLESDLRKVLRNEDYGRASSLQEQTAVAGAALAQTEVKLDQTDDILDRYEELLEIAEERLIAIENNREIIIAGLRVFEVPGIEDLGILDEGKPFRRGSRGRDEKEGDIFGAGELTN